jgi:hypothetical protein
MNKLIEQPHKKADWLQAKLVYIENPNLSYADIARMFGVSLKQVKKHGAKNNFVEGRQEVSDSVEIKIKETIVDERVKANERHAIAYKNMQSLINTYINIISNDIKRIERQAAAEGRDVTTKELYSTQKLFYLIKALKTAIDGERVTLDLPTKIVGHVDYGE